MEFNKCFLSGINYLSKKNIISNKPEHKSLKSSILNHKLDVYEKKS